MSEANPKVDFFFSATGQWQDAYAALRPIILGCGLVEELKWGKPCYTLDGGNVVLMHGFKDYCALLFHKGALLDDPKGILVQQTENVQAARQIRFTDAKQIAKLKATLKSYIRNAIEVERAGLKVAFKKRAEFAVAGEFQSCLDGSAALKEAFEALTPGRQKGYLLYFSSAKQAKTREARVERCMPRILEGLGLDD
jgi:uncharacterized protein YdeI (YjbR/CyaY-like superfamily)